MPEVRHKAVGRTLHDDAKKQKRINCNASQEGRHKFGGKKTIKVNPNGSGYVDIHIKVGSPNATDSQGNPMAKKQKDWITQINEF